MNASQQLYSPQLNHISMKLPHFPLMPARHMIDQDTFCNSATLAAEGRNCRQEYCQCPHVLEVPLNSTVELVIVDEGKMEMDTRNHFTKYPLNLTFPLVAHF